MRKKRSLLGVAAILPIIIASFGCRSSRELSQTPFGSDPSLVANYRFEGNSSDSKGSNNGTDTNITYGSGYGKFGQGALFDGTSSFIQINSPSGLPSGNHDLTINLWANPRVVQSAGVSSFVAWGREASNQMAGFGLNNLGFFWLGYINDINQAYAYATGTWQMFTAIYIAATKSVQFYANGAAVGSGHVLPNTPDVGSSFLIFSKQRAGNPVFYDGQMDDVSIFSRVLTPSEISNLYSGGGAASTGRRTNEVEGPPAKTKNKELDRATAMNLLQGRNFGGVQGSFASDHNEIVKSIDVRRWDDAKQAFDQLINAGAITCTNSGSLLEKCVPGPNGKALAGGGGQFADQPFTYNAGTWVFAGIDGIQQQTATSAVVHARLQFQASPFYSQYRNMLDRLEINESFAAQQRGRVEQIQFALFDDGWRAQ